MSVAPFPICSPRGRSATTTRRKHRVFARLLEPAGHPNPKEGPVTAKPPWRVDSATMICPVCDRGFAPAGRRRYCSDSCRRRAWARRRQSPATPVVVPPPLGARRPVTVYECDRCGGRALGQQRCDECGGFMRRVGLGGRCPSCDAPLAAGELIEVAEPGPRRRR